MRLSNFVPFLCLTSLLAACGSSSSDSSTTFTVNSTGNAVAGSNPIAFRNRVFVYLASETSSGAGGSDLNADGDMTDSVAVLVDMGTREETVVGIAAESGLWLGTDYLYLSVDESKDGFDYDGDGDTSADDLSLVLWDRTNQSETFLGALPDTGGGALVEGDHLFFAEEVTTRPGMGETTLRRVDLASPAVAVPVTTSSDAPEGLTVSPIGVSNGLLYGTAQEVLAGADLNGDGDSTDTTALVLLDATGDSGVVHSTGLALQDADAPFEATARTAGDWLVAVLVSETAHVSGSAPAGAFTGFNDPELFGDTWQPPQCAPMRDIDTLDQVLFWIDFADFASDPVANPPVNSGLVGTDRVIALDNYVATISLESDDGGCDLNGDGDSDDRVVRFVETLTPVLPHNDQDVDIIALALASEVPGGTYGLAAADGRFIVLVDEESDGTDYDGKMDENMDMVDNRLLGWRDPASGSGWIFDHGVDVEGTFMSFFQGATWMAETPDRNRLLVAVPEDVEGVDLNFTSDGGDGDLQDSFPSFAFFTTEPRLSFPFVRFAVDPDNAGIVLSENIAFYRVSEPDNGRQYNNDGDMLDQVLYRSSLSTGETAFMGTANSLDRPVIELAPGEVNPVGSAFLSSEPSAGVDFNNDGDMDDFVWRYFRQ